MSNIATYIGAGLGGVVTLGGAIYYIQRLYRWLWPVAIIPSVYVVFDRSEPDEIRATITNRSREPVVIVRAAARATYPTSVWHDLRKRIAHPRRYSRWQRTGTSYLLLPDSIQRRLDPLERIELRHRVSEHPLSAFLTSHFLVELELSTGRVCRSECLEVPRRWTFPARRNPDLR